VVHYPHQVSALWEMFRETSPVFRRLHPDNLPALFFGGVNNQAGHFVNYGYSSSGYRGVGKRVSNRGFAHSEPDLTPKKY